MDDRQMNALVVLESVALACRENARQFADGKSKDFAAGLRLAYLDALSVLVEEAGIHGVPLSDIGLEGYDPYRDPALHTDPLHEEKPLGRQFS